MLMMINSKRNNPKIGIPFQKLLEMSDNNCKELRTSIPENWNLPCEVTICLQVKYFSSILGIFS